MHTWYKIKDFVVEQKLILAIVDNKKTIKRASDGFWYIVK